MIPIVTGTLGIFALAVLYRLVTREKTGTPDMRRIAGYIQEGAQAFIKREVRTISYFIVALVIILFFLLGWEISVGFALGAGLSVLTMVIGMKAAVKANVRTVNAARSSAGKALQLAFRGGGVMGLGTVSINLLGIILLYFLFSVGPSNGDAVHLLVGFGFGASPESLS